LILTYNDPAPDILGAVIIEPGDQIQITFSDPVAINSIHDESEFWNERNCSFFITSSSNLWRDGFEGDCRALFHTAAVLVLTVNFEISYQVVPGNGIAFNDDLLRRANSLFSKDIGGDLIKLTRASVLDPGSLVISSPDTLSLCSNLIIDLSSIGNLDGKNITSIEIQYVATPDSSDIALRKYIELTKVNYIEGALAITIPSRLITSRTYDFSVNASSSTAFTISSFQFIRKPGNFPTVTITKPIGIIDSSVMHSVYASVDAPCDSISNPTLFFRWLDGNGTLLSKYANLVLKPYQLEMDSTHNFTLECYYDTFSIVKSSFEIVTAKEALVVSTGGDQLLGVRSGIELTGQFSSNLEVVEFKNYRFAV
jgi:hypothetical protein